MKSEVRIGRHVHICILVGGVKGERCNGRKEWEHVKESRRLCGNKEVNKQLIIIKPFKGIVNWFHSDKCFVTGLCCLMWTRQWEVVYMLCITVLVSMFFSVSLLFSWLECTCHSALWKHDNLIPCRLMYVLVVIHFRSLLVLCFPCMHCKCKQFVHTACDQICVKGKLSGPSRNGCWNSFHKQELLWLAW